MLHFIFFPYQPVHTFKNMLPYICQYVADRFFTEPGAATVYSLVNVLFLFAIIINI